MSENSSPLPFNVAYRARWLRFAVTMAAAAALVVAVGWLSGSHVVFHGMLLVLSMAAFLPFS